MLDNILEFYNNYKRKVKLYGSLLVIILVFCLIYYLFYKEESKDVIDTNEVVVETNIEEPIVEEIETKIFVDVKGEVITPGVYELNNNSRVIDAINASGGLTDEANTRYINLSKLLNDGDVIIVYSNEEIDKANNVDIVYVDMPCVCEEVNNACLDGISTDNSSALININTATVEDLQTLDGIGESKANSIIEYRTTNGPFKTIEEITNVKGISETIYEKIKDYITVE